MLQSPYKTMSSVSEPVSNSSMQPWEAADHRIHLPIPASNDPDCSDDHAPSVISSRHRSRELSDIDSATHFLTPLSQEASSTSQLLYGYGMAFNLDSEQSFQRVPPYQIELEIEEHEQNDEEPAQYLNSQHVPISYEAIPQSSWLTSPGATTSAPQPRVFDDPTLCLASLYRLVGEQHHLDAVSSAASDEFNSEPAYTHLPSPPQQEPAPYDESNVVPGPPHTLLSVAMQSWWDALSTAERIRVGLPRWEHDEQRLQYYRQTRAFLPEAALMSRMHDEGW